MINGWKVLQSHTFMIYLLGNTIAEFHADKKGNVRLRWTLTSWQCQSHEGSTSGNSPGCLSECLISGSAAIWNSLKSKVAFFSLLLRRVVWCSVHAQPHGGGAERGSADSSGSSDRGLPRRPGAAALVCWTADPQRCSESLITCLGSSDCGKFKGTGRVKNVDTLDTLGE